MLVLSIREQRRAIKRHLQQNPSLKSRLEEAMINGYEACVDLALRESDLQLRRFPERCLYSFEQIIKDSFFLRY
ncbi:MULTISPECIES: DUF29 family protein [unclassified Moorena]|uniref:DUF29 family protein n=1 Tax=unclassified Moorena TaxID=2683338 RepID=UPI0025E545CD|nr:MULTISPECIES: DUF29 family protein [unclassified Moorena]